jgi:hypothetical protein
MTSFALSRPPLRSVWHAFSNAAPIARVSSGRSGFVSLQAIRIGVALGNAMDFDAALEGIIEKAPLQRGQISPLQLRFWNCGSCRFPSVCKDNSEAGIVPTHSAPILPEADQRKRPGHGKADGPFVRWFESVKANQWALNGV